MTSSVLHRLSVSAARIKELRQETRAEMDRRDDLIRDALNEGHIYRHVSNAANRAIGTVAAIASKPPAD